jgi:hypothetical protein
LGYIKSPRVLECPLDTHEHDLTTVTIDAYPVYDNDDPLSYQWIDFDATTATNIPPFRYLTDRGIGGADRDVDRVPYDGRGTLYQPDDTALLTYCALHRKTITKGGQPQYLALFYEGRVEQMPEDLFRAGDLSAAPPEEAWRVWPGQTGWSSGAPLY